MQLQAAAKSCLLQQSLLEKCLLSIQTAELIRQGSYQDTLREKPDAITEPGRPDKPELVPPNQLKSRKLGSVLGRVSLLHAIAHIEFNAINLAWDAIYRFPAMPDQYYLDWASVAHDETRHFSMLNSRLQQLGYQYGDFPAHNGLWEMALKTQHDITARMALVPRVLEARGLDVTPGMIERLDQIGDPESAGILRLILSEEVRHVEIGSRWFAYLCEREGRQMEASFLTFVNEYARGSVRLPMNRPARMAAGFSNCELDALHLIALSH